MFYRLPQARYRRLPSALGLVPALCGLAFLVAPASAATWTIQTTPNAIGAEHSHLYDISCYSTETKPCVSVGKLTQSGGKTAPYAQAWNGTSWSNISASAPEGATAGELQSADCIPFSGSLLCFAAGSYASAGVTKSLIVLGGTGGLTSVETTPNPEGASETALKGMACKQSFTTACFAVGYSVKSGKKTVFAIGRNSESKWVTQAMPEPAGATSAELHGVDCPTTTFCVAVGNYTVSGSTWTMSATWNGASWTLRTVPTPAGSTRTTLLDVSCSSASSCTGVGAYRNGVGTQLSFVQRWNGSSWSYQVSPNPAGSANTVFQGVSCISGTPCVAVGDWLDGKNWEPMAQEWNGSAWALDTTPGPSGSPETLLEGVACRVGCLSVGWYVDSFGKTKTLAESR